MESATHYVGYQNGDHYWNTNLYANDELTSRIPRLAMVMGYVQARLESDLELRAIDYIDHLYDESGCLRVTVRSEMADSVPAILFPAVMEAWEKVAQEDKTNVSFSFSKSE